MTLDIRGVVTELVTPFRDGVIDEPAFIELVERQVAAGVQGLALATATGEGPTLSQSERRRLVELCVQTARGRVAVIAGVACNATSQAIVVAREAKAAGAQAALVAAPAYIRPSQEGLYLHYRAIAETVDLPVLIDNTPDRARVDLAIDTLGRLASFTNLVGVADATGDLRRVAGQRRALGEGAMLLSGDDLTALGHIAEGGDGVLSVSANLAPEACVGFAAAARAGDLSLARLWQARLTDLHESLSLDASPAPVKFALSRLGLCTEDTRLPIAPCAEDARPRILAALAGAGLL